MSYVVKAIAGGQAGGIVCDTCGWHCRAAASLPAGWVDEPAGEHMCPDCQRARLSHPTERTERR